MREATSNARKKKKADKIKSNLNNMTFEITCDADDKAGKTAITSRMGGGVQMSEINKSKRQTTRLKVECLACLAICDGKTNETINKESREIFSANELTILIKKDKLRKQKNRLN